MIESSYPEVNGFENELSHLKDGHKGIFKINGQFKRKEFRPLCNKNFCLMLNVNIFYLIL